MQANVNVINLDKFKDTVLYSITIRKWGNSMRIRDMKKLQAYMDQLKTEIAAEPDAKNDGAVYVASDAVKSTKRLVRSKSYEVLCSAMNALKKRSESFAMPSFVRPGMFIVKQSKVEEVEQLLKDGWKAIQDNQLAGFIEALPGDIENARTLPVKKGGLGPLFNEADYPSADDIKALFGIEWFWTALSVPENIPDALKAEANEKFKRRMEDAAQQIENALRQEFLDLISHAEERLTSTPGEKPKVFRDSAIGNIVEFIRTFDDKNMFADERLGAIVLQAKSVLLDDNGNAKLKAQSLRDFDSVRKIAKEQFASIRSKLDGLIEEKGRRLDLSED